MYSLEGITIYNLHISISINGVMEMESCAFVAHGVSDIVKERLMDVYEKFKATVCDQCGIIVKTKEQPIVCQRCKTSNIVTTTLPYAFKLLSQELMGFNIVPRIQFK